MNIDYSEIISILSSAGIVALPTDTVFGLAVDPQNHMALQKLYRLKGRDAGKPLVWMVAEPAQIENLVIMPEVAKLIIAKHWPGPLTIIFKEKHSDKTIGFRIPNNQFMLGLLKAWARPLAVTSANLSGEPELPNIQAIQNKFGRQIDLYVDSAEQLSGKPSTIIDVSSGKLKILRQGELEIS